MPLTPVDHDPFAPVKLTPVDHDPFASAGPTLADVMHGAIPATDPDILAGAARATSRAARGLSLAGEGVESLLNPFRPDAARDQDFAQIDKLKALEDNLPQAHGALAQVKQAAGALPLGILTLGAGEAGAGGMDAIDRGATLGNAQAHLGLGALSSEAGLLTGHLGGGLATRLPLQGAASGLVGEGSRLAENAISPPDQQQPFDPVHAAINVGSGLGGAFFPNGHQERVAANAAHAANIGDSMAGDLGGFDRDPVARATAPAPADLKASEHATPATAVPAPGDAAIASLVSNFKQELSAQPPPVPEPTRPVAPPAEQGRAATPVPPPPPEIAAMLDKLTPEQKQATGLGPLLDKLQQPGVMELPQAPGELPKLAPKPHFTGPEVADRLRAPAETGTEAPVAQPAPESTAIAAPSTASSELAVNPVEPNVPRETPFTPEERHQQQLDQHLTQLGELTPEQRQAVIDNHGSVELDPVMQLPGRRELVPSIEAAKQQGGGAYGEFDIRGVGNLNSHLGSNSAADPHLRAIADIVNRNLQDAAKQSGGQVVLTRKGGDELGAVAKGVDAETLHAAGLKAKADVDAYVKANGLDKVAPTKIGGEAGVGLHFGVSDIAPTRSVGDIISDADRAVELRKKGKVGYEYARETGTPGIEPSGRQAGGADGSADAGLRQGSGGRTDAPERAAAEANPAETGDEVALAEPKTEAVKAPPQKPAETTLAEPRDTSVRNAATAVDRATLGLDDIPQAERKGWDQSKAEAAQAMAKDPDYARNLAREVLQSKRAPTDAETMALGAERARLHDAYEAHDDAIVKAMESGDQDAEVKARIAREATAEELDTNHRATQAGGTELARAMAARNAQITQDYSTPRTLTRARVAYGEKLKPATEQKLRDFTAQLAEKDAKFAELQGHQHKIELDANAKEQARLQKQIDEMEGRLAKRLKACPL